MSYVIDDDATQIRGLLDKIDDLQGQILGLQSSIQTENVDSGESSLFLSNPAARPASGTGGGTVSIAFPLTTNIKEETV